MTKTTTVALSALAACVVLASCTDIPDYRRSRFTNPFSSAAPGPGVFTPNEPLAAPVATASAAEVACLEAGRAAGFDVQGVVGTREVVGAGGLPSSRDVMLNVQRSGQSIEVRCSYAYLDATAQIMTL